MEGGLGQHLGGGGGGRGGVNSWVSSTSKNCPSHHKYYKAPKRFELKQS